MIRFVKTYIVYHVTTDQYLHSQISFCLHSTQNLKPGGFNPAVSVEKVKSHPQFIKVSSRSNYLFTKQVKKIKAPDWSPSRMAATEQCASEGLLTPRTTAVYAHPKGLTHTQMQCKGPSLGGHNHGKHCKIQS